MDINDLVTFLTSSELNSYLLPFKVLAVLVAIVFIYGAYKYTLLEEINITEWRRKYSNFFTQTSPAEKKDFAQRFQEIVDLLNKKTQISTKAALIKNQYLLQDILKKIDFPEETLGELSDEQLPNAEALKVLILSADKVKQDPAYLVNIEKTKELFIVMRDTLLKIGII